MKRTFILLIYIKIVKKMPYISDFNDVKDGYCAIYSRI